MTMVVPSAPPGPRALPGSSDSAQPSRTTGDGDFAAALSETMGDGKEDAGGDEVKAKSRDMTRPPTRAIHRLEARERRAMAALDKAGDGQSADIRADMTADGHLAGIRDAVMPVVVEGSRSPEVPDTAQAGDQAGANAVAAPLPATPRGDPARDALAVLGRDLTVKRETVASTAERVAPLRRQPLAGGSMSATKRLEPASGETGALDGSEQSGDVPDIGAIPIRVVRQETHFQPIAHEARRLLGMAAGPPDDRVLPPSLAAAARLNRPQALQRDAPDMPMIPDRVVDAKGAVAPVSLAADGATFGSIGQQIADGVQRAMEAPADQATTRSAPGTDPAAAPAFAPAVRSIKLQLNPHSLGVVTIVLTGSDGDLRVHLEAERAETFGKVEQERGALSARLNGAGYAITELTVGRMSTGDAQARDGDQREPSARQGGQAGAQMGSQQGDSAGGGARESAAQFAEQRAGRQPGEHARRTNAAVSAAKGGTIEQAVAGISYAGRFRPV
jgi:hypothetical protein